jgi:hypothetical protein
MKIGLMRNDHRLRTRRLKRRALCWTPLPGTWRRLFELFVAPLADDGRKPSDMLTVSY